VTRRLSFTDAAEQVLQKFGGKKPMHYRDIATKALESGLVSTMGKTPEATLYAQVLTEIQRRTRRGERPRFVKHGKGYIGLSKWMAAGAARAEPKR
jgi:restriction system protein